MDDNSHKLSNILLHIVNLFTDALALRSITEIPVRFDCVSICEVIKEKT